MTTNDELARLRAAFAAPGGQAPEPEACPPSDTIWLAVRGELPPDELRAIVDHIATCPACAEDWRIAKAFEEEAQVAAPAVPTTARPKTATLRQRAWMAVAATILVAVVGFQIRGTRPPERQPDFRSGQGQIVEMLVPEGAALSRRDFILSWKGLPEAASYDLRVTDAQLNTLYEADGVTATTHTVPESAMAGLAPGTKLYWTVTPVSRDGAEMQSQTSTRPILLSD